MDKAAVASFYSMIWEALPAAGRPNPHLDIHQTITQGDVLACRFTMSGVHQGTFMGASATGRAYVLAGVTMIRYRDGKAIERWSSADMLGLLTQLGARTGHAVAATNLRGRSRSANANIRCTRSFTARARRVCVRR